MSPLMSPPRTSLTGLSVLMRYAMPMQFTNSIDTTPEGPELGGYHKGIQQAYTLSTLKEKTPTAAMRAAKGGRKPIADRPYRNSPELFYEVGFRHSDLSSPCLWHAIPISYVDR